MRRLPAFRRSAPVSRKAACAGALRPPFPFYSIGESEGLDLDRVALPPALFIMDS